MRPAWRRPSRIRAVSGLATAAVGWLGIIAWAKDIPWPLKLSVWLIALAATAWVTGWILIAIAKEAIASWRRLKSYDELYDASLEAQASVHEMSRELTMHGLHPESTRTIPYDIKHCMAEGNDVFVTLDERGKPPLSPGLRLRIADREDGKRQGEAEVTDRQTISGKFYVKMLKGDALFLGALRKLAGEGNLSVDLKAQAHRTMTTEERETNNERYEQVAGSSPLWNREGQAIRRATRRASRPNPE